MSELILVEAIERGIWSVTLNRPDRRNALSIALLEQLCAELEQLADNAANRVAIVRGAGPVFSAGLDLQEAADSSLIEKSATSIARALSLLQTSPLIFIAAVQGGAFAGGAGLMAACDVAVAATDAKIGFPEARRGLLPALISHVLMHKVREGDLRELPARHLHMHLVTRELEEGREHRREPTRADGTRLVVAEAQVRADARAPGNRPYRPVEDVREAVRILAVRVAAH